MRVKFVSEAAPLRPSGGSGGGCRQGGGFARRRAGGSIDGRRSGLTTAWCWRTTRGWVLGPSRTARFGGREGGVTESASGAFVRLRRCQTSTSWVSRMRVQRGSPSGEDEWHRSECLRRTIAALPGAGCAGNSTPASATSSPLSARVSARVMGRWAKRRAKSRKRRAREWRDRWVLVATSRLQRSQTGISARLSTPSGVR